MDAGAAPLAKGALLISLPSARRRAKLPATEGEIMKFKQLMLGLCAIAGSVIAFTPAVSAQPRSGPVLASELFFEDRGPNRLGLWTADALLSRHPAILRTLRAEGVRAARLPADECSASLPCNRILRDEYMFSGTRLLSIFSTVSQFTGGAHGSYGVAHRIFDLRTGRRLQLRDLFTNWRTAQPLLQTRVCAALREKRPETGIAECPSVNDIAFALAEASEIPVGGRATGFNVRTSDYQLASYADGTEEAFITLDAQLLALIKPEYRADFRLPAN
jgi:hypothetical protein